MAKRKRTSGRKKPFSLGVLPTILLIALVITLALHHTTVVETITGWMEGRGSQVEIYLSIDSIPEYDDSPYVELENNIPLFTQEEMTTTSFEIYYDLDDLGRCTLTYANVGEDLMPTEDRGSISHIYPTGWESVQYDNVDGTYLYNRCHLIGFQLTGENANEENLITGTRYLNVDGMLPFENEVADYVQDTGNHVLYRVTPIFEGDDLVAQGVQMEAYSVEDEGEGVCFHVFVYNVQPGIELDYATGASWLAEE